MLKKIIIPLFFIFFSSLLVHCNFNNNESRKFIVAVDIGHSKKSGGALSARGEYEYKFNRDIAIKLLEVLKINNFDKSFIINEEDENIPLVERTKIAKKKKADILISIHNDSVQPQYLEEWKYDQNKYRYCDKYSGYSIFISQKNPKTVQSIYLAKCIGQQLRLELFNPSFHHTEKIKGENRELIDSVGIYKFDDLIILKTSEMPTVLIECGIIVNRTEEIKLKNPDYINKMCGAITEGIIQYFNNNND